MDFKNSETAKNLMRAFAGESQARNRYTFAAGIARKEGLFVIESVFSFTADQEKEHGEIFYNYLKELGGETIFIDGGYPVDQYEKSLDYLKAAHHNEYEEFEDVYQNFAKTAKEEGFSQIATSFSMIAEIERTHGDRFQLFAEAKREDCSKKSTVLKAHKYSTFGKILSIRKTQDVGISRPICC